MLESDSLQGHRALVAALREPIAYPPQTRPNGCATLIETHISSVLLAGDFAYKLKKPVDLGFANFTTLARRREYCDQEVRLNRRTAPALYLDVVPVTRASTGEPRFGGAGEPVDHAVRMQRFGDDARFDQLARAGGLDAGLVEQLATAVASFHGLCAVAAPGSEFGTPGTIRAWIDRTTAELCRRAQRQPSMRPSVARIAQLVQWMQTEYARRSDLLAARHAEGFVRECHGDLHLGNVALIDGVPVPFDCIEFNPELRYIDVMNDVAFAWMDLLDHGLPHLAARFLNRYLEVSGDYAGLATLRLYAAYRALVRALVALIRRDQADRTPAARDDDEADCLRYLRAAERISTAAAPLLVLVAGVTGSGKTTVAEHLVGMAEAVRVRSDVERKRLAGLAAAEHRPAPVDAGLYRAATTRATYRRLVEIAAAIVDAGLPALVDATFQRRRDRTLFRALATRCRARFRFVLCEASEDTLRERVAARTESGNDASDATLAVLAFQLRTFEALRDDELRCAIPIDTDADRAKLARRCESLAATLRGRRA